MAERKFRAFVVDKKDGAYVGGFRDLAVDDLPHEKVLVDVAYSSLNYKDGLAITGKGKIVAKFPMVCGIDLAGTVADSSDPRFKPGDTVFVNGAGLSETLWGGYSQRMRVNGDVLTKIPPPFTAEQIMAIGTAGFTAMLGILALEHEGISPDMGEVVVTGAAGGVGSIGIALFAKLGYQVAASTGRAELKDYLTMLGADTLIPRAELDRAPKPLEAARWAGGLDGVGGATLATVLAQTKSNGAIAAYGLAGGAEMHTSVMPFILRGVKLLGTNCIYFPKGRDVAAWRRLAADLDLKTLAAMTQVAPLSKIQELAETILKGGVRGRIVIDVNQ